MPRDILAHQPLTKRDLKFDPPCPAPEEFVISQSGQVRQAGADPHHENWVKQFRARAERHLYVFCKSVLGLGFMLPTLHLQLCQFLQTCPPNRKLAEIFREGGKTMIVGQGVPLHIHIQPKESNLYFPGEEGCEQRGILIGETERRSTDSLRVIKARCENNDLMRALWPHRFWQSSKQAKIWSSTEIILPRQNEWPDPTLRAMGVGAAITGSHPSYLDKDDLVTVEAANSETVMQAAIDWHILSRALINKPSCLEFIDGTRWAIHDLYSYIEDNDPSVEILKIPLIHDETGEIAFPETTHEGIVYGFSEKKIEQLQKEFGVMYPLLYLNRANDPSLMDFDEHELRWFTIADDEVQFTPDQRDVALANLQHEIKSAVPMNHMRGMPLDGHTYELLRKREQWIRVRAA